MPVQRRIFAGEELLVSMSRDRLLVAMRLGDVAKIVGMEVGKELREMIEAAGASDEVWPSPVSQGVIEMISLEGVRALMMKQGSAEAQVFMQWLDIEFPESAAVSSLNEQDLMPENLHRIGEMRRENPDIQPSEIAGRLSILEDDARRYLTYLDLLRNLK